MEIQKNAIVSGAFGYVGFEISKKLAQDGMRIALLYHNSTEEVIAQKLTELSGGGHRAYRCDLKNVDEVQRTIDTIEKDMGSLYACVHAAGVKPKRKQLLISSIDDLKEQLEGNVIPSFNFLSLCAKKLKEHGEGVLVGITTVGVVAPKAARSLGAYIPAKYAVQGMLTMLKEELSESSVRVYSVAPGFMHGGMNNDIPKAFADMIQEKNPAKKLTTATDVAEKIAYLCSGGANQEEDLTCIVAQENELS